MPEIGNNVYIGAETKIIGEVTIANNIVAGANAVVNKSFTEDGIIIAGVPAGKIGYRKVCNKPGGMNETIGYVSRGDGRGFFQE